jgi:hypothetical protein
MPVRGRIQAGWQCGAVQGGPLLGQGEEPAEGVLRARQLRVKEWGVQLRGRLRRRQLRSTRGLCF